MTYGKYQVMKKDDWIKSGYRLMPTIRESLQQAKTVEKKLKKLDPEAETIIFAHETEEGEDYEGWYYRIYINEAGKWTKTKKIKLFDPEIRAYKLDYAHAWQRDYVEWIRQTREEWPDEDIDPESWIHRNSIAERDFMLWIYKEGYLNE